MNIGWQVVSLILDVIDAKFLCVWILLLTENHRSFLFSVSTGWLLREGKSLPSFMSTMMLSSANAHIQFTQMNSSICWMHPTLVVYLLLTSMKRQWHIHRIQWRYCIYNVKLLRVPTFIGIWVIWRNAFARHTYRLSDDICTSVITMADHSGSLRRQPKMSFRSPLTRVAGLDTILHLLCTETWL